MLPSSSRSRTVTIPPPTRKRKLDPATAPLENSPDSLSQRKASKTAHTDSAQLVDAALPATPQTLASDKPMDSDDDFNSQISSEDMDLDFNDADSSVDFGAAGEYSHLTRHMISSGELHD